MQISSPPAAFHTLLILLTSFTAKSEAGEVYFPIHAAMRLRHGWGTRLVWA